jgi:hypothetical protein
MTKETAVPDPINPDLALALAAAAGLDTSDLKEQIRRQQAGDDDPDGLHARIAELEAQVSSRSDSAAPFDARTDAQDATAIQPVAPKQPHEILAERLDAAQSKWLTLGGPGGSDGEAA